MLNDKSNTSECLTPGTPVRVRSRQEIEASLDENGMLEGVRFVAEMVQFCGRVFTVTGCIERTWEEARQGMRQTFKAVLLDGLRCDGSAHGGCPKRCSLLWKESWLEVASIGMIRQCPAGEKLQDQCNYNHLPVDGQCACQTPESAVSLVHVL
jgi:hypothetical protein